MAANFEPTNIILGQVDAIQLIKAETNWVEYLRLIFTNTYASFKNGIDIFLQWLYVGCT